MAAARLARAPHGLEHGGPPGGRAAPRPVRRAPLHRLDVPAAAGRRARDDDPRPRARCAFPSGRPSERGRCTGASTRTPPATCDVIFVNSEFTGADVDGAARRRPGADPRRAAGRQGRCSRPTGPAADLGAPYILTRRPRSSRARTCRRLAEAHRLLDGDILLAVAGGEGWGEQPRARRSARASPRLRLRRGAGAASTGARPWPSTRRGSRASGCRSSRRWRAARRRRVVASVAGRGLGRRRRARRSRRSGRDRSRDRAGDRASASGSSRSGIAHAARFTWRAAGEAMLAGYEAAR